MVCPGLIEVETDETGDIEKCVPVGERGNEIVGRALAFCVLCQ